MLLLVAEAPTRRLHRVTEAGVQCLEDLTAGLDQGHRRLSAYLERHRALTASHGGASPGGSPSHRLSEHVDALFAFAASR
ncbi:MAG: hypothetical protein M3P85_08895 [Actinomycetota bacterium]|nr:hypothetical protein [Actinomycetota bacterium]